MLRSGDQTSDLTSARRRKGTGDGNERLLRNNGGKKLSALTAISRKAIRLLFTVAREGRPYVPADEWAAAGRQYAPATPLGDAARAASSDGRALVSVSAQLARQQRDRQDRINRRKRQARAAAAPRRCPAA